MITSSLRSSVIPEGDRHVHDLAGELLAPGVAILGRPGGRPPPATGQYVPNPTDWLRFSVTLEGDRHKRPTSSY